MDENEQIGDRVKWFMARAWDECYARHFGGSDPENPYRGYPSRTRVHNHPPHRPPCNERDVAGQLRGACLNDDGTDL